MLFAANAGPAPESFHDRLEHAYKTSSLTPDRKHGRFVWVSNQLRAQGVIASPESVRKWFAGLTRPRGETMAGLARVLGVDPDWLETGRVPDAAPVPEDEPAPLPAELEERLFDFDSIDFSAPEFDEIELMGRERESREADVAAGLVAARLMFAGVPHRRKADRILVEAGSKAREIAVVLLHKVADRGGAWLARLPRARSGFEPYTASFDAMLMVLPRGGREPALFAVRGRAAALLGKPRDVISVSETGSPDEPAIQMKTTSGRDVSVRPLDDLAIFGAPGTN